MDSAKQIKFVPPPKLAEIEKAALSAGFDKKVTFPKGGISGVTKFYKYKSYGTDTPAWRHERDCLNRWVNLLVQNFTTRWCFRKCQLILSFFNPSGNP